MTQPSFLTTFGPLIAINSSVIFLLLVFYFISRNRSKTQEIEDRHSSVILNKFIREFWFWVTHPIFLFFIKFKISPNAISILGSVAALASGVAFAFGKLGLGGWIMVLGASLDFFDGRVARALNKETLAGSYIDSCMDRISEGVTLIGIGYVYILDFGYWIVMLVFLASQLTSYTKAKGETMGVDYSGGMMQRPERIAYLGAGAVLSPMIAYFLWPVLKGSFPGLSMFDLEKLVYLVPMAFVGFFASYTSVKRIVNVMKLLDKKQFGS